MNDEKELSSYKIRKNRDRENRERSVCDGKQMTLYNLRATDLPYNKDVVISGPVLGSRTK